MKPGRSQKMTQSVDDSCRVCLNTGANILLFSDDTDSKTSTELLQILMTCTSILVCLNDPLPKKVCEVCEVRLRNAHQLRKLAHSSDVKLREEYGLPNIEYPGVGIHINISSQVPLVENIKQDLDDDLEDDSMKMDEACYSSISYGEHDLMYESPKVRPRTKKHSILSEIKQDMDDSDGDCYSPEVIYEHETKYNSTKLQTNIKKKTIGRPKQSTKAKTKRMPLSIIQNSKKTKAKLEIKVDDMVDSQAEVELFQAMVKIAENDDSNGDSGTLIAERTRREQPTPTKLEKIKHVPKYKRGGHECNTCMLKFHTKKLYAKHMKVEHQVSGIFFPKNLMCDVCGKLFTRPALKYHKLTHLGEKPHGCEICGMKFMHKYYLMRHISASHRKVRRYHCKLCPRRFRDSHTLSSHVLTHTGEKPHGCTLCDKTFSKRFTMMRHMQVHSGERPYGCRFCQHKCGQSNDLRRHVMRSHPDAPVKTLSDYCVKTLNEAQL